MHVYKTKPAIIEICGSHITILFSLQQQGYKSKVNKLNNNEKVKILII